MLGFPKRQKIPHPDGINAYYTPGIVFDNGAEHLAYRNDYPHPLLTRFAGFVPRRNIRVTNPQTIYQFNALPVTPIIAGFVTGQVVTQALTQQGQITGTQNNVLVNNTLFGGVQ
jgi:hypothetical protein